MTYPYEIDEHDIPPGVTVACVKDTRTGQIVRDCLANVDLAEAIAERMNEEYALRSDEDEDEDEDE